MPVFDILKETLISEEIDFDLGSEEETPDEEVPTEESSGGDAEALVDALLKYAPGKETEIKSMLKYAANSNPDQDVFDDAFEYFNTRGSEAPAEEPEVEVKPEAEPTEEPAQEAPSSDELAM